MDKPFARSSTEADKIIDLARDKGLILTCFQNRRWVTIPILDDSVPCWRLIGLQDGDFMTLRHLLNQNALGAVKEAEIHYDFDSPSWLRSITAESYEPGLGNAFGLGEDMPSKVT